MGKTATPGRWFASFAAVGLLAACERPRPERVHPSAPQPASAAPAPAPVLSAPAALSRSDLLSALATAASNYAADGQADSALAGRTFAIRLPFGCLGPARDAAAPGEGLAEYTWSDDRSSILLTARPADWTHSPLVLASGAGPTWDGVEGFWIERPWLLSEKCPEFGGLAPHVVSEGASANSNLPEPMTAGLAAIQSVEGSRLGRRRGKDYSFTIRGAVDKPAPVSPNGYRLVLEGRVGTFPDGAPVRCTSSGPNDRPICVVAVQLDVVAFEDATGARLSEWRAGI